MPGVVGDMRIRHIAILFAVIGLVVTVGCITTPDQAPTPDDEGVDSTDVAFALIYEYDPGTTEGMPTAYSRQTMNDTIDQHPELSERVRAEFNATTTEDTFYRIQQTQQIQVTEQADGNYSFTVRDGNACTTTVITGTYNPTTDTIAEGDQSTETQPC